MSSLDERTKIPIGWAGAIVIALLGVVSSAAVAQYRINDHDYQLKELKADLKEKAKADAERDLDLREMSGKLDGLNDKMDDVKRSVEKLDRSFNRENTRR